jgi:transposase-like protein
VSSQGKQYNLWRAVVQDGEAVDVFLQARRDGNAVKRLFRRLRQSGLTRRGEPRAPFTAKPLHWLDNE